MLIYKATKTLDGYLPPLDYTDERGRAELILVGGRKLVLSEFPNVKGVFKTGVGTDNLPIADAEARGVAIALPSETTCGFIYEETAAFTCHLILSGLYTGAGNWETWRKLDRPVLSRRRLLVVGNGRIGRRVADKMRLFMDVKTYDSAQDSPESFHDKIRDADAVTLHVPLTAETRSLFDAERLALMRDGALLVNTSRGPIVHEDALYAELASGRLRAAFDVFWEEPYRGRLTELPADQFMRTPHIASTCKEFVQGAASDFLRFMATLSAG